MNSSLVYVLEEVNMLKIKGNTKATKTSTDWVSTDWVLKASLLLVVFIVIGVWFFNNCLYLFVTVCYVILYSIYCTYYLYKYVKDMWKNEPSNAVTNFWAVLFLVSPILMVSVINQNISSDSVKLFYTVAIGIGVNSIFDSVIKSIEPEIENNSAKELLAKKSASMKIFFNSIYISGYTAFVVLELIQLSPFKPFTQLSGMNIIFESLYRIPDSFKLFLLNMVFIPILIAIASNIRKLIRKELNNEMKNQIDNEKDRLKELLSIVSKIKSTIQENNDDIINNLDNIESKIQAQIKNLDELDAAEDIL